MINSKMHLRNSFFLTVLIALFFIGCNKEPKTKKYVARVNNAYLTEEDVNKLDSLFVGNFSRSELIKKWLEQELLYQEAVKAGIADEDVFIRIMDNSRRELASSMLLNSHLENVIKKPNNSELQEFYDAHKNEFTTENNIYIFNSASFNNENTAIKFRTKLVETNWEKVTENYAKDKSLIEYKTNVALSIEEIYPIQLLNLIEELDSGEVSIVLEENTEKYWIVQLLQVIRKGTNPPFEIVREQVETRYVADKRGQIFNEFIKELYSKNEIEIKEK